MSLNKFAPYVQVITYTIRTNVIPKLSTFKEAVLAYGKNY